MNKSIRIAAVAASTMALGVANAAAGDPDVSAITAAGTSVGIVGAAVFAVYVAVKGFKWFRSAL